MSSNSRALPAFPFFESFVCSSLRLPAIYCSICYVYLLSHFICAHIFLSSFPHMRHVYLCVVVFRWSETFIHFGWRLIDVSAREKKIKIILFAVCTLHKEHFADGILHLWISICAAPSSQSAQKLQYEFHKTENKTKTGIEECEMKCNHKYWIDCTIISDAKMIFF